MRRLLADSRSRALIDNFAGQWLQLRNLDAAYPAVPLFPDFDDSLRQALRQETELFVASILRDDRSALELLTADYTFLNERLALHYGIPGVRGSHFRRVTLRDTARRGLLGHGSVLTVTSRPNRTSPVLRGKWILENILGTPPPAPPPNVPPLPGDEGGAAARAQTMRQRMAAHRENPVCAGCHADDRSARLRAREFRCDRPLAGGRCVGRAARRRGPVAGRGDVCRPGTSSGRCCSRAPSSS